MGVSETMGTLFRGPFKGILYYLGCKKGVPLFWEMPQALGVSRVSCRHVSAASTAAAAPAKFMKIPSPPVVKGHFSLGFGFSGFGFRA